MTAFAQPDSRYIHRPARTVQVPRAGRNEGASDSPPEMPGRSRKPRVRPTRAAAWSGSSTDWRDATLRQLRAVIEAADPAAIEEIKWRKPSNPDGVPVWSHAGILCVGNVLKSAVRLTFPKGARIRDPKRVFNARLDSGSVRAVDVHEGEAVDEAALIAIVRQAVRLNTPA